jgi:lantibiotic biosynthesis dehydratase-like protein
VRWRSVHVYYYDDDKNALILDGVRPLFRRLSGTVDVASYTRHWKRGPHLRLNVCTDEETFAGVVRPAVTEVIGGFLAAHPSTRRLDPQRLLPLHRRLAELEYEQGPLLPWYPDNSIQFAPFDRRVEVLGNEQTADLIADFYADTTELAFTMTEQITSRAALLAVSFDLLIATAHAMADTGITRGFVSYRSHAEGFLCGYPEGEGQHPAWDEHYERNAATLVARVDSVVKSLDAGRELVPYVRSWVSELGHHKQRASRLAASGISPVSASSSAAQARVGEVSSFHRRLFTNPSWRDMQESEDFVAYRLMVNLTYLHLTRLGVTPIERLLLCHLAANAVEERYGISAFELVRQPFSTM